MREARAIEARMGLKTSIHIGSCLLDHDYYNPQNIYFSSSLNFQGPTSEPLIRAVWGIWGQDQVACKVFPIAMASGGVHKIGSLLYTVRGASGLDPALASLTNMPVKEGLQSIIKCLKAQDTAGLGKGI